MKKLFSVLLALALLLSLAACGKQPSAKPPADTEAPALPQESEPSPEPEPEPEPAPEPEAADPRALWTAAETASAAYDSYEMEFREDLTAVGGEQDFVSSNLTVIRGKNMNDRMMQYEAVTTGDSPCELYYINGVLHKESEDWQYTCALGAPQFREYLNEDALPFLPEQFGNVELIGQEDGWEIAFSDPLDTYIDAFTQMATLSSMNMKEGTLEVSGTILLDEEGFYESTTLNTSWSMISFGNLETEYQMTSSRRWLTHDEEVTVVIPSKVKDFTDVTDIRVIEKLEKAAAFHDLSIGADYATTISFDGTINGEPVALTYDVRTVFLRDIPALTIQLWETATLWGDLYGQEQTMVQETAYEEERLLVTVDGETQESILAQEAMIAISDQNYCQFTRESEPEELFWFPHGTSADGAYTIHFESTGLADLMLYGTVLQLGGFGTSDSIYNLEDYEIIKSDGTIVLDEESGAFRSLVFDFEDSFTLTDGTVIAGTLRYERQYLAYNRDVVFEPGTGIGQGT